MGRMFAWMTALVLAALVGSAAALAQPAAGQPPVDAATLRGLMANLRAEADAEAAQLTADLASKDVILIMAGDDVVRVTNQSLDNFLAYLQLAYVVDPAQAAPLLRQVAPRLGVPVAVLETILEGNDDFATAAATALAMSQVKDSLRTTAAAQRARVEAYIAELRGVAALAGEIEQALHQNVPPPGPPAILLPPMPPTVTVPPGVKPPAAAAETVFNAPTVNGIAVDRCRVFGADCDQPAADNFCRSRGLTAATAFDWAYMRPTHIMGDGQICDADYCGGFTRIACR